MTRWLWETLTDSRADLSPPPYRQTSTHARLMSRGRASHHPSVSSAVLQPAKGACLPSIGPQDWDAKSAAWTAHSSGQVCSHVISLCLREAGLHWITLLPFLPNYICIFLITACTEVPPASFQLVISENCSTFWCVCGGRSAAHSLTILIQTQDWYFN